MPKNILQMLKSKLCRIWDGIECESRLVPFINKNRDLILQTYSMLTFWRCEKVFSHWKAGRMEPTNFLLPRRTLVKINSTFKTFHGISINWEDSLAADQFLITHSTVIRPSSFFSFILWKRRRLFILTTDRDKQDRLANLKNGRDTTRNRKNHWSIEIYLSITE